MKYQKGLVSVIMPTYRDTVELNRAIDSVLAQTYPHIECILINDNTPDDEYSQKLYQKIARYRQDPRFVFFGAAGAYQWRCGQKLRHCAGKGRIYCFFG